MRPTPPLLTSPPSRERAARQLERDHRRLQWLAQTHETLGRADLALSQLGADSRPLRTEIARLRHEVAQLRQRLQHRHSLRNGGD